MTIGDACHKVRPVPRPGLTVLITTGLYQFEPLTGQGGNLALETAAALTNSLMTALDKKCLANPIR